jgi:hypothetical protein
MSRSRFLAAVLGLLALLGAAEVRSAAKEQQRRLVEFQQKAMKERQEQGLDKDRAALFAKYPTPEVTLVSASGGASKSGPSKDLPTVPVGSETTLSFTGRFVPGTLAHVECMGAEVISEKATEKSLEARVRVTAAALPGECEARIISPVSLATAREPAFRVVGKHQWELQLANGMKARLSTSAQPGSPGITGTSEWFDKGGKSLGTRAVNLARTEEGVRVDVQRTQEEVAAASKARGEAHKELTSEDAQKVMREAQLHIKNECMKLPPDKMGPCIEKYTAQMKAVSQRAQGKAQEAEQKVAASTVGCDSLSLQVSDGKVTGRGSNCGAPGDVNVIGSVAAAK